MVGEYCEKNLNWDAGNSTFSWNDLLAVQDFLYCQMGELVFRKIEIKSTKLSARSLQKLLSFKNNYLLIDN